MYAERGDNNSLVEGVVRAEKKTQTNDTRMLCIEDLYQKFNRPNFYNIGGSYIDDVMDYWFSFKTENLGQSFLLHMFVASNHGQTFRLAISYSNHMPTLLTGSLYFSSSLKEYEFLSAPENKLNYITTYSFNMLDIPELKDKKVFIPIKFLNRNSAGYNMAVLHEVQASHNFSALLDDPICSDFIIESAEGHQFKVHKLILSAQSEVFNAMLKENTAESQNNFVRLSHVNKDDLYRVLQFFYTGTISDLMNINCSSLMVIADQYDLRGLFELLQHILSQQLSSDTVLEILTLSDLCNSYFLKMEAMKFIKLNPSILNSNSFKEFKNANLMREICQYMIQDD